MEKETAIKVEGISKTFTIPHEKISTLKGAFVSAFKTKSYERFKALDDISFEVKKGEFFGIIGRNGSGKSTLLKILAGIYQPNGGSVKINGRISPFLELGIGFNPELSGRDNIYLNAAVLGLTHKQIDEKFDDIVEFSELRRFIDQKVKNYSSGMQVRLMFSVAIHANREILLMDEVLAVGDTNFQSKCLEEFNKYRSLGKTVVLVTHDIGTVQRYCDRAMLLRNGKIEMIGNPQEVGNRYIYQNMSDEEKRIVDMERRHRARTKNKIDNKKENISKEERRQEQERKNKIAEITKVEFLDESGKSKNVFETGENLSVRVHFEKNQPVKDMSFGLAIYNQESDCLIGISTAIDKINIEKYIREKYFQVNFQKIPLRTNSYYISIAIFGETGSDMLDFINNAKVFKVFSRDNNQGMVNVDYHWS